MADLIHRDSDGLITVEELGFLFAELEHEEEQVRVFRKGLVVAVGMLLISIICNLGTAFAAFELAKDTKISSDGKMMTTSGEIVKTASDSMSVSHKTHPSGNLNASANATPDITAVSVLTDRITGNPLKVEVEETARLSAKLTSELSDASFDELEVLSIRGPKGKINFKVNGYARYDLPDSRCGTVVVLYMSTGHVQFDGTAMTFNEAVGGSFSRAGFRVSSRRRGRRADDSNGYTLVGAADIIGQFRFLADAEFDHKLLGCGDDRPSFKSPFGNVTELPQQVTYTETVLVACGTAGKEPCPTDTALLTEFHGISYFTRDLVTIAEKQPGGGYHQITEMAMPELPGYSVVMVTDGAKTLSYTRSPSGEAQHCKIVNETFTAGGMAMTDQEEELEVDDGTDDEADTPALEFIGYDVLNGVYVRHYTITGLQQDGSMLTTDYYEHYDERRMFALPIDPTMSFNTINTVATSYDRRASVLQGPGYPDITDVTLTLLSKPTGCELRNDWNYVNAKKYTMVPYNEAVWLAEKTKMQQAYDDALAAQAVALQQANATRARRRLRNRRGNFDPVNGCVESCAEWGGKYFKSLCTLNGKYCKANSCYNYFGVDFACSGKLRKKDPEVSLGGRLQLDGGVYNKQAPSPAGEWAPDIALTGCVTFEVKQKVLKSTCRGGIEICAAYHFLDDEIELSGELSVNCGPFSAAGGAAVTFGKALAGGMFPKLITGAEVSLKGCASFQIKIKVAGIKIKIKIKGCVQIKADIDL